LTLPERNSVPESDPDVRNGAFIERGIGISVLVGLVLRIRILLESPVPVRFPVLTLTAGGIGGLAFMALAATLLLLLARGEGAGAAVRRAFGAIVLVHAAILFVWSEVLIYFGHPPRAADLDVGFNLTFYADSLWTRTGAQLGLLIGVVGALLACAGWSARRARSSHATTRSLFAAGAVSAMVWFVPVRLVSDTSGDPLVEVTRLGLARYRSPKASLVVVEPVKLSPSIRRLAPGPERTPADPRYPMAYLPKDDGSPRLLPAGARPNVIFLILEGMQAGDLGSGAPAGLTPNLDALAAAGYRFDRAYSPGAHTEEGELAYWYGLLPLTADWLMPDHPLSRLTGLPDILRARGWRDFIWMYGGDQTFYGRERFYGMRGFRYFDAADFLPDVDVRTSWGFSDMSLARRSIGVLRAAREPFAAMFVTISNHHPFKVPEDAVSRFDTGPFESRCYGHYTRRMLETMHYADDAVGDFFRRARKEPWFANTVFVVGGDHGLPIEPVGVARPTAHQLEEFQHRIPLILYSPLLAGGRTLPGPSSQVDVLPTLLHLIAPDSIRTGTGTDLLARDPADRPIVLWSGQPRIVSVLTRDRTYHGIVKGTSSRSGAELERETWVNPEADPAGTRNLAALEPEAFARARNVARAFLDAYPLLVESGHSGAPPGSVESPARSPAAAR
jgi:arylsulfatase A-like enzyme